MNAKEREILERQRQLAAQLKPASGSSGASSTRGKAPVASERRNMMNASDTVTQMKPKSDNTAATAATLATSASNRHRTINIASLTTSLLSQDRSKPPPPPPPRPPPPPHTVKTQNEDLSLPKRPSKKRALTRPGMPMTTTTSIHNTATPTPEQIVAAARALAEKNATATATTSDSNTTTLTTNPPGLLPPNHRDATSLPLVLPRLKRKEMTHKDTGNLSSLAKLVQNVSTINHAVGATQLGMDGVGGLPSIAPDDFWKNLREWDFVSDFANQAKQQQQQPTTTSVQSSSHTSTHDASELGNACFAKKPIPNVFLNPRHYTAAWAPLCLAECRAQILQEAASNRSWTQAVLVQTESTSSRVRAKRHHRRDHQNQSAFSSATQSDTMWLEDGENTAGYVLLQPKHNNAGADMNFLANDVCLLVQSRYSNILREIDRGVARPPKDTTLSDTHDLHAYRSIGLIGHTETPRNGLSGLVLKVSKRHWATIGQTEMYLIRLGGNVTALREFTALCKVDTLPLKRYLLGQHLEKEENRRKLSSRQSTEQLLELLGGKQSLGIGFIDYCRAKFNASQLTAIAAAANEYGEGGFTLIKGPPGTGKTTTLTAVLNSLHIRQYNKYYEEVRRIAAQSTGSRQAALELARKAKPRLLVCAPSNAAVDNIILKIMEDGFIDGQGQRYNPSMIRVGVGQSDAVRAVALETKVDSILEEHLDLGRLDASINCYRSELSRITQDITRNRQRLLAIQHASPHPLAKDWEIRVDDDTFDETGRAYFVNHKLQETTYVVPPPPEEGVASFQATSMPEYRAYLARIVKLVESFFSVKQSLERCTLIKGGLDSGSNHLDVRMNLESHVLNSVHIVMTTLGTAGNRTLEGIDKFEVVVVDEAAQSVEPASLSALQLGNRHAVLVGDPQQLPATIFNVSGRNSKYDRSLFQRLEEAGQPIYMLNEQYRMHPKISHFPRHIFYGGALLDGPNVKDAEYGNPLRGILCRSVPTFQPLTILDLDSNEERGGTSLSNYSEARLAVYLYLQMKVLSRGLSTASRVAIITPYAEQMKLLRRLFSEELGPNYTEAVEVNTVDAFQGRESNIVVFSAVRAAGSRGVGFLADIRRMNVALTRAKHFLFVIARCESIIVNPYWRDLVQHARESKAVVRVPMTGSGPHASFGELQNWPLEQLPVTDPRKRLLIST